MDKNKISQQLGVVIVGHVDHGKSTLIGRLLNDTNSLEDGKIDEIKGVCERRGVPFEWSFVLDAFQAERDQAVTIDTTQIFFSSDARDYVIIDAPGHREFLKNMISGASQADAAVLVVDADEGVREQTRRHAYMLHLLGMKQIAVVINKMDKVNYDPEVFENVSRDCQHYLESIGLHASYIIPIAARDGDMLDIRGDNMLWYKGKTLLGALDSFEVHSPSIARPLRFPIQDVYRFDEKRILVGRVETGILRKGDTLFFSPTNEKAVVTSIESWPLKRGVVEAQAGQSVGITLSEPIFVERGHIASHEKNLPMLSNVFQTNLFWLSERPLKVGNTYRVRYGTNEARVSVQSIDTLVDTQDLKKQEGASEVQKNAVAEVTFRARDSLPIDPYKDNDKLGRVVVYEEYDVVGGGLINMDNYPDQRQMGQPKSENIYKVSHSVNPDMRAKMFGHYGGIFWLTGLSGSGKSTLAVAVEQAVFKRGKNIYVLDGDNVRHGLNADLGFSPEDRTENIRRIGEVAALQANAGVIVLSAFISPYQQDRDRARMAAPHHFHEIYVKADLETCEGRDPKGLYKKARSGEIKEFTGIDSPYEPPKNPDLVVDTKINDVETCVSQIVDYIEANVQLDKKLAAEEKIHVLK
ncbi:MAG: adenylyl-sulfate kinase [Micavibrio sp.]|nr:adenylyl-sulfate kinase [Micavibrio sp.]